MLGEGVTDEAAQFAGIERFLQHGCDAEAGSLRAQLLSGLAGHQHDAAGRG